MFSVEKLSKNITKTIENQLDLDNDRASIIEYGLYAFFQMSISILITAIIGAIFNVMIEALLISFVIAILRKSSGGVHASTSINCTIVGALVAVTPAYLIKHISFNSNYIIIIGILLYIISFIIIYKLAPVDSPNKPIKKEDKIKRLKRGSIIILSIYMIVVLINLVLYYRTKSNVLLLYSSCIYIGIIWQVFTLTKLGHIIVKIIDSLLIKIIRVRGNG